MPLTSDQWEQSISKKWKIQIKKTNEAERPSAVSDTPTCKPELARRCHRLAWGILQPCMGLTASPVGPRSTLGAGRPARCLRTARQCGRVHLLWLPSVTPTWGSAMPPLQDTSCNAHTDVGSSAKGLNPYAQLSAPAQSPEAGGIKGILFKNSVHLAKSGCKEMQNRQSDKRQLKYRQGNGTKQDILQNIFYFMTWI